LEGLAVLGGGVGGAGGVGRRRLEDLAAFEGAGRRLEDLAVFMVRG
jgi:hypothetical protein